MYVYVYMYVCVYTHNAEDVFRVKYIAYIGYIGMCIHKYTVHTVYSSQYILFSIQMLQPSSTMVYRVYSLQFTVTTAQQEQTATLLPHYSRNGSWFFSKNDMHFAHALLAQTTRRPKPAFSSGKCMFFECFLHVQP